MLFAEDKVVHCFVEQISICIIPGEAQEELGLTDIPNKVQCSHDTNE
jgi:hypothetical protein